MSETSFERQLAVSLKRLGLVPVIAIAALSCRNSSPTLPTPPPPTESTIPFPTLPGPTRIAGLVRDTGNGTVPGATLTFNTFRGPVMATTDAAGSFAVTVEPWVGGLDVLSEKPGYERSNRWIAVNAKEVAHDLRLHPIVRVAAGDSLGLSIRPDDPSCGLDLEFLCRTVRIQSPIAGRLRAEVVPDRAGAQIGLALSTEHWPQLTTSPLLTEVAAASETSVNVLVWWQQPDEQPFTLITSMNP
jgi:hypothetical protein